MKKFIATLAVFASAFLAFSAQGKEISLVKNVVIIEGPIGRGVLQKANELMKSTVKEGEDKVIDIVINSPGGSVYAGWQFISAMKAMQARGYTLRCTVTTMAASMAYQILSECDERYAFEFSTLLWHPVRLSGMFTLTPKQALGIVRQLQRIERILVTDLRAKFDVDDKTFWRHYHAETLHITKSVADMADGFITIVSNVKGLDSLSNLRKVTINSKVKPKRAVPGPKKHIGPHNSPSTVDPRFDIFIYMNPTAYKLWMINNTEALEQ